MTTVTSRRVFTCCALIFAGTLTGGTPARADDAHTVFSLPFNNTLIGAQGEAPTTGSGITYESGVNAAGAFMAPGNQLYYVSSGNINAVEGTLEFWVKPRWNGNDGQTYTILRFGGGGGMLFAKDGANNLRSIFNRFGVGGQPERGVAINVSGWVANAWHHVAYTWSTTTHVLKLYVDGQMAASSPFTGSLPAVPDATFQIGGDGTGGYLDGVLDDLRISDLARSDVEIAQRMNEGGFRWVNPTSGNFSDGAKWQGGQPPGPNDSTVFGLNGSATPFNVSFVQDAQCASLDIRNQRPILNLGGRAIVLSGNAFVGRGETAYLTLSNGNLDAPAGVGVGLDTGNGVLRIDDGASVHSGTFVVGAGNPPSIGDMTITGNGTSFSKTVCCDSDIGRGGGCTGTMTISDYAAVPSTAGNLMIGRDGGNGTLILDTHGSLHVSQGTLFIGQNTGSIGQMSISGSAVVHVEAATNIGDSGAHGTATISDAGSSLTILGNLNVGLFANAVGTLTIANGGQLVSAHFASIGLAGATGSVTVDGPGSSLVGLGLVGSGTNGHGTLVVSNGGHVSSFNAASNTNQSVFIGEANNDFGEATVTGVGSRWDDMDWLTVGGVFHTNTTGHGSLRVLDGGRVSSQLGIIGQQVLSQGV